MNIPGPLLLMPLRLEIRHDSDARKAMIRWYPDECQICPAGTKSSSLEDFLAAGFELTAFPRHVSLLTMDPSGRIEPVADGTEIYNPDLILEVNKLVGMFSPNLQLDEANRLLIKDMTADTWSRLLKNAKGTLGILSGIFEDYKKLALDVPPVKLNSAPYAQVKAQFAADKVTGFAFDDANSVIRLKDLLTDAQIQALSAGVKAPELKNYFASLSSKQKSVSLARFLYGVFPPRFGALNDVSTEWITDFAVAEKAGLAITIAEGEKEGKYPQLLAAEWLIAVGRREDGAGVFEKIIRAHKSAKRFKIIRQGEPTNNTSQGKAAPFASGGSSAKPPSGVRTNGELLAQYLGVPGDLFTNVENADLIETDIVRQLNAVLWPACIANYPYPDFLPGYRDFFVNSVTGRGLLPSIRIGENPYGFVLTSSPGVCNATPFFNLIARPIMPSPRARLVRLAESHGRQVNTQGMSIEALWAEYQQNPLTRSFLDYVLFLRKKIVFSEHESDYDRLENILRQNAFPRRIDLEVTEGDAPAHFHSRDHLLLEPGADKSLLIDFLKGVKDLLQRNALFLQLLLLDQAEIDSLKTFLGSLSGRVDILVKIFDLLKGNAPYPGRDLSGYGTKISGFYDQLDSMLGYSKAADFAEFDLRADRLLQAISKQGQDISDELSGMGAGMLSALRQLNGYRPQVAQPGGETAAIGGAIRKLASIQMANTGAIRAFTGGNGLDEKTLSFVSGKITSQQAWIDEASNLQRNFTSVFTDINNRALASIDQYGLTTVDQYGISSDPLRATPVFDAMLDHPRGILAKFASGQPLGDELRLRAAEARRTQASLIKLSSNKQDFDTALKGIKFHCSKPALVSFKSSVSKLLASYNFSPLEAAANLQAFQKEITAISTAGNQSFTTQNSAMQKDLTNSVGAVQRIVQGQRANFSRQTLQTGMANLKKITDAVSSINGSLKAYGDSHLQADFGTLGKLPDRISEWMDLLQNFKEYLPLLVVWKKSRMPMLQRMLLLSALYASVKPGLVHTTVPEMQQGLSALIDWLGRDGVEAQDLETMMLEVVDCFSARFDAWMTACAAARLAEMKKPQPNVSLGCGIGVYGFLEQPLKPKPPQMPSEFFQAPSLDQAKAAAVLRAGSLTDDKAFQINLSQPRAEKALWFFQGLQKGYPPSELLGRYAERLIHDNQLDVALKPLRDQFPLIARAQDEDKSRFNIIDGEKFEGFGEEPLRMYLVERLAGISRDRQLTMIAAGVSIAQEVGKEKMDIIEGVISKVWLKTKNLKDAAADLSIAETVYQQIRGNTAKVQAWLEAAEGKGIPPLPEVIETPRTGKTHIQRILLLLKAYRTSPNAVAAENPRSLAEPTAAELAKTLLPDFQRTTMEVKVHRRDDPGKKPVYSVPSVGLQSDLGLSPFDLVIGEQSLLEGCLWIFLWRSLLNSPDARNGMGMDEEAGPREFMENYEFEFHCGTRVVDYALQIHQFLKSLPALQPQDLSLSDEAEPAADAWKLLPKEKIEMWKALRARVGQLSGKLGMILPKEGSLPDGSNLQTFLLQASLWGTPGTGIPLALDSDKAAVYSVVTCLRQLKIKLDGAKAAVNDIQSNVPLGFLDAQGKTIHAKISFGIYADDNGASVNFTSPVPAALDLETTNRFNEQRGNLARLRFDELLSSLIDLLKSCGGEEKMILLPPFAGTALDIQALSPEDLKEFGRIRFARKNIGSLYDLLKGISGASWSFQNLSGQALKTTAGLRFFFTPGDVALPITDRTLLAGFKLDEWPDFIANPEETTGIAFNYNVPQNEAPNAILLSVPSPEIQEWTSKNLGDTVANVIDLMRIRTLTTDEILSDPQLNKRFPVLYYLSEFARDFPKDQILFSGTLVPPAKDTASTGVNYFPTQAG